MSKKRNLLILANVTYGTSAGLALWWYDWKLWIVIFLFVLANNWERRGVEL